MIKILRHPVTLFACWYLSAFFAGIFALPAVAQAAFGPSVSPAVPSTATADPAAVDAALDALTVGLEDQVLRDRLLALGVSAAQVEERLGRLTAEERQTVLADISRIQTGGDAVGSLVGVALLVLIIILIVKLVNKEIVIK
jgi:hypothetical protein